MPGPCQRRGRHQAPLSGSATAADAKAFHLQGRGHHQRAAPIADQIEVCRRYIDRNGWTLTKCYDDAAISGASRHRLGYLSLLADAEAGKFDVLVCEAVAAGICAATELEHRRT